MTEALAFSPFEESAPIRGLGTKSQVPQKEAHETQLVDLQVSSRSTSRRTSRLQRAGHRRLREGRGLPRPAGRRGRGPRAHPRRHGALRDFSYIAPEIPSSILAERASAA